MTEKPYLLSLIGAYSEANDRGSLKTLKESLSNYELTNDEREEIERLIDKGLGGRKTRPGALDRGEIDVGWGKQYYCVDCDAFLCGKCALKHWDKGHVITLEYDYYGEGEIEKFYCEECDVEEERERLMKGLVPSSSSEGIKTEHEAKIAEILVTLKTNPDGISDALEEAISPEMREKLADLIRVRMERKGLIESIDWGKNVADYIDRCEKEHGTVMMRTRYATDRFEDKEHPGRFLVLMVCYSRRWSQWFGNCPLSDIEKLERD